MFDFFKKKKAEPIKLSPTEVLINGTAYNLELNNYSVREFGRSVGAKTPVEAIQKLVTLKDGYTFAGQDLLSKLLFHCLGEKLDIKDCFSALDNKEVTDAIVIQIEKYTSYRVNLDLEEIKEESEKKKAMT